MSEIKVNKISPKQSCTQVTLGDSGDTFNLPSGGTLTIACGATITNNGTQTGFGRAGTVDWDTTPKTAAFTAVSGTGYFVNTTSAAITVTTPSSPSAGDIFSLADYAATWATNGVTVSPNGTDKIGGVNASASLGTKGQSVTFVYVDSTQGWLNTMDSTSNVRGNAFVTATGGTETTCGDYKIHTFTSPGTFTVTNAGAPVGSDTVDYLVVAGGGGGGSCTGAGGGIGNGGGGAGGYRESSGAASGCYSASPLGACVSALPVSATAYPITVGAGGGIVTPGGTGYKGSDSIFSTITAAGGGGGMGNPNSPTCRADGGSGGGGTYNETGGVGNSPPVSPAQGNNGEPGVFSGNYPGGGGGGATQAGGPTAGGEAYGGDGATSSINGTPTTRAGGGGGGFINGVSGGPGGAGGGGRGGNDSPSGGNGVAGTANTGGAGGGASGHGGNGASGGSGIVIIRYKYQ